MTSPRQSKKPFVLDCSGIRLDLARAPAIMGIINVTPDSFYDGGKTVDLDRALDHALAMIEAGASIIDVGGESTRPGAATVSAAEEIRRTVPLITLLRKKTGAVISIDTFKSEVARAALKAGAGMVNDISGFTFDSDLPETCRKAGCAVVLMHTSRHPEDLSWSHDTASGTTDILARVMHSLRASVATAQTHRIESIVVDPGFGFGKSVEENFRLLGRLDRLHEIGYPVLAGVSRKSFLGHAISRSEGAAIAPPSERLAATLAAQTIALQHGADILRVHDVEAAVHLRAIVQAVGSASR